MTIAAVIVGVLIVVVVGIGQLGGRVSGTLQDPAMAYPAALLDGANLGKAGAPVVMQVYEDYQCPVCAKYSLDVEPVLVSQYVAAGKLRIEHNDLGILGNPRVPPAENESIIPARGAFCANEQGKYWDYAHWIYANQDGENAGGFRRDRVVAIAEAAGVEPAAFNACLDGTAAAAAVDAANAKATELGINSTPTLYIGGKQYVGLKSAAELGALIEAELAASSAAPSASPGASASAVP
jgi:protein-disulfide isomerase